jgi:hypothetical protein
VSNIAGESSLDYVNTCADLLSSGNKKIQPKLQLKK